MMLARNLHTTFYLVMMANGNSTTFAFEVYHTHAVLKIVCETFSCMLTISNMATVRLFEVIPDVRE